MFSQIRSGHITPEQARVSNPCIAPNTRAVTAPSQFRTWRDNALEQIGPYRCHVRCCSNKGLTGCSIADGRQCQIAPQTVWVRIGWITSTKPNRAAGGAMGSGSHLPLPGQPSTRPYRQFLLAMELPKENRAFAATASTRSVCRQASFKQLYQTLGEGARLLGCSGTDPLRWALALVADLTPFHLLDAGAASRFLMPSTFAAFLTSGALTHRSAP